MTGNIRETEKEKVTQCLHVFHANLAYCANQVLRTSSMSHEQHPDAHSSVPGNAVSAEDSSIMSHSNSVSPLADYSLSYPAGPLERGYFTSTAPAVTSVLSVMDSYSDRFNPDAMAYSSSSGSPDEHDVLLDSFHGSITPPVLVSNDSILRLSAEHMTPQASSQSLYSMHRHSEQQAQVLPSYYDQDYLNRRYHHSNSLVPLYQSDLDTPTSASSMPQLGLSQDCYESLNKKPCHQPECRRNSLPEHFCQKTHSHSTERKHSNSKKQSRHKDKKRCTNCHNSSSPSWRRSISKDTKGNLLCNACGLYEKTAKKKRMLLIQPDGNTKVIRKRDFREFKCSNCKSDTGARWRRISNNKEDQVVCEKCARSLARR
ncbi:hypothetical protein BD560DRAFT_427402 [Blakeslea trispora]|nr:hypothetical protein BD560DRAFT_427402 [Blakeslea trispora]